ncbi:MAG: hypothetical protein JG777_1751 [Clostridia bacterium]|jgi:parallel beta-helix repeat protein|nr:hypothetical protein [Clostridia bacterium]
MNNNVTKFFRTNMFIFFILVFVLPNLPVADASQYYVATWGNDSNAGLFPNSPWKSLSYASTELKAGDTLYVINGTWFNEKIVFKSYGTITNPIVVTAYNGTPTLIGDGTGNAITMVAHPADMQYITISNLTITNYDCGIYIESASGNHEVSHIILHNNTIHSIIKHPIYIRRIGDSDYLINNLTISNNFMSNFGGSGIFMLSVRNSTVINNVIRDSPSSTGWVGIGYSIRNCVIEGNYLENISASYGISGATYASNNIIRSNTIKHITGRGIRFDYYSEENVISDNVIIDTGDIGINLYPGTKSIVDNNTIISSSIWITGTEKTLFQNNVISNSSVNIGGTTSARSQVIFEHNLISDSDKALNVYNTNDSLFKNNTFTYISAPNAFQFFTGADSPSYNITLVDNVFSYITGNAIYVGYSKVFNLNMTNNTFINVEGFCIKNKSGYNVELNSSNIEKCNIPYFFNITDPTAEEVSVSPESSGSTSTSFTPSATSFTASVGSSTTFSVDSEEQFTSTKWYVNGVQMVSGTTYTQNWAASGSFAVSFEGVTDLGTLSRTWNVVVSGSEYSDISIIPSAATVKPGETFSLDVYIDPKQPVTGAQFNLQYGTLASVTSVKDGGLFKTGGLTNTFQSGLIDNSAGVLKNVYSAIVGSGTVSTPGSMATVNMVAGSSSGMLELTMSNVVLSDAYSNPAPYDISYASVLVDTAPVFNTIPAKSVEEESTLTFTVSATDADGDILTYSCTSLPQGATFDASAKTFRWTPSRGQAGTYSVQFGVTDGYLNDTTTTTITVSTLDRTPVITLFEPASGSVFEEGRAIDMRVVAEDPEGKTLSYIVTIDGVQVSSSASYQWVTDYSSAGTHSLGVTVSDGNTQTSRTHTITIKDVHPRWDVNQDGLVNILDITLVGQNYGRTYTDTLPRWDVNQDGIVNVQDMSIVAGRFGETVQ